MGIVQVTANPSKYVNIGIGDRVGAAAEYPVQQSVGEMYIQFTVKPFIWKTRIAQREISKALGKAMGTKPVYHRGSNHACLDYGYYEIGGWYVDGFCVTSKWFDLDDVQSILDVLGSMSGFVPNGELSIHLVPDRYDMAMIYNAQTIIEARKELIEKALSFKNEFMFIIDQHPTFSIPLDVFDLPVIEACIYMYHQIAQMAWTTKKARMKPCDMSNPKYHMRTWLLRLGFIGPQFERARQTLLENLNGDMAFYNEEQKRQGLARRKAKRLNGGGMNVEHAEPVQ